MTFKIEKNIPIAKKAKKQHAVEYPFGEMDVGDSFYIEEEKPRVQSAFFNYGRANGKKFFSRKEGVGRRIWRIA